MEVLARVETGGHTIDFGIATTRTERQAVLAQRFRVFLRFHEIDGAHPVYPRDGPVAGYFYAHPDPAALIYWFADEVAPAVRRALGLRSRLSNGLES